MRSSGCCSSPKAYMTLLLSWIYRLLNQLLGSKNSCSSLEAFKLLSLIYKFLHQFSRSIRFCSTPETYKHLLQTTGLEFLLWIWCLQASAPVLCSTSFCIISILLSLLLTIHLYAMEIGNTVQKKYFSSCWPVQDSLPPPVNLGSSWVFFLLLPFFHCH